MRIVHIGPPLSRTGGPAGYLYELARAAQGRSWNAHDVVLPSAAAPHAASAAVPLLTRLRPHVLRVRRHLTGPPRLYRPTAAELNAVHGIVHTTMVQSRTAALRQAHESIERGLAAPGADVLFAHDLFCAEHLLQCRRPQQQVWLLLHNPMPLALYLAWNWGNPERDWHDFLDLPDVRAWIDRELDVLARVDRLLVPCSAAGEELARADARFAAALARADYLLTGAAGPPSSQAARRDRVWLRRRWRLPADEPVGLFLGNAQPYRGLDVLIAALGLLPPRSVLPGALAVAGPGVESLPFQPRLHALGRVDDVAGLLAAVDFVVNVNRFSLFDLSTIEAAEAGKPLLLHAVGGNKTFRDLGVGCVMLADLDPPTVAVGLRETFALDATELQRLGQASRACYQAHLTPAHLWARHVRLYDEAGARLQQACTA